MKRIQLLIVAFVFPLLVFAGNGLREADHAFASQQYFNAMLAYKKAQASTAISKPEKIRAIFQIGECNRMMSDWLAAENFYNKAIKGNYPDDIVWLRLAQVQQMSAKYPEAIISFGEYGKRVPSDPAAPLGIRACTDAQNWLNEPNRWVIQNESQINSKANDFCPTWSDRKHFSIVFSSKRPGQTGTKVDPISGGLYSDLFEAKISNNGKWSTPETVQGNVNLPTSNDGASCITKNGTHIFYTRCDQKKKKLVTCKIYYAEKKGNTWDVPTMVDFGMDAATLDSFNFRHPAVSANEDVMVFSSDMNGTTGGTHSDLWISTFDKKTKKWSRPVNMGGQINTSEREGFPYISDDGSLYYSSDGLGGLGGLDLYRAPKTSATEWKWGAPENLKTPFNSPADDFGIIFDGKQKKGYLTSNRTGTKGADDIWRFYYEACNIDIIGVIEDCTNKIPVKNALVELTGNDGSKTSVFTDKDGKYKFKLSENVGYVLNVFGDSANSIKVQDYFSLPDNEKGKVTTVGIEKSIEFTMDFCLPPLVHEELTFPAVLYDLDQATLRPESKDSLNYLYQILIDNPNIVIELGAHTDCRGTSEHNRDLAQRRAQACVDYLVNEKGIAKERLIAKGYGEDRPLKLASGVVLTEKYINTKKTTQEREALHQLNRRTVFQVISTNYVDPKAPARSPIAPINVKKGYFDESGDEVSDDNSDEPETPVPVAPKQ